MTLEKEPQIVTTGKIRQNAGDGECIHFSISLGMFILRCVVNVPEEGTEEAPVYVKFRIRRSGA